MKLPKFTIAAMTYAAFAFTASSTRAAESSADVHKPRIIVTTDLGADSDDEQSLVRLLVSANEFDIEGLIVSTGCWKKNQSNTAMLDKIVDAYGKALPNLQVHAKGYPSLEYLKSISVVGQTGYGMSDVGEGKDSKGSELIIAAADRNDPRPVWVQFWGGGNDPLDPAKPGWGGQFKHEPDGWRRDLLAKDGFDPRTTVSRWRPDFQSDFAKRMAWGLPTK